MQRLTGRAFGLGFFYAQCGPKKERARAWQESDRVTAKNGREVREYAQRTETPPCPTDDPTAIRSLAGAREVL